MKIMVSICILEYEKNRIDVTLFSIFTQLMIFKLILYI